jgi:hypothetical protein
VLRRIFGPDGEEVARSWRGLHSEELHNLYASPDIWAIKSEGLRWVIPHGLGTVKHDLKLEHESVFPFTSRSFCIPFHPVNVYVCHFHDLVFLHFAHIMFILSAVCTLKAVSYFFIP